MEVGPGSPLPVRLQHLQVLDLLDSGPTLHQRNGYTQPGRNRLLQESAGRADGERHHAHVDDVSLGSPEGARLARARGGGSFCQLRQVPPHYLSRGQVVDDYQRAVQLLLSGLPHRCPCAGCRVEIRPVQVWPQCDSRTCKDLRDVPELVPRPARVQDGRRDQLRLPRAASPGRQGRCEERRSRCAAEGRLVCRSPLLRRLSGGAEDGHWQAPSPLHCGGARAAEVRCQSPDVDLWLEHIRREVCVGKAAR
mmetsp:Transcript_58244/g.136333  ORF Transcript_58244/g.136333 Transcript_58244/m.136333 type:complete len:251 (+) Transcript_58244:612-1364(+)